MVDEEREEGGRTVMHVSESLRDYRRDAGVDTFISTICTSWVFSGMYD